MVAEDFVIEYIGEVVRSVVADQREASLYDSTVGAGTYIFSLDDHSMVSMTACLLHHCT